MIAMIYYDHRLRRRGSRGYTRVAAADTISKNIIIYEFGVIGGG